MQKDGQLQRSKARRRSALLTVTKACAAQPRVQERGRAGRCSRREAREARGGAYTALQVQGGAAERFPRSSDET